MKDLIVPVLAILTWLGAVVLSIGLSLAPLWITGSLITSGVKASTNNCGKTYPIEVILSGDWFCESK